MIWSALTTYMVALLSQPPLTAAQYCGQPELVDYLNFSSSANAPVKAVVCPYVQGAAGMPPEVLSLLTFGTVGMALTVRVRHPGPLLVAFILTGGIAAASAPGGAINVLALVLFVGIAALGLYLYQRAQSSL